MATSRCGVLFLSFVLSGGSEFCSTLAGQHQFALKEITARKVGWYVSLRWHAVRL